VKLFSGLDRTDYQDLLRALGAWIDERGWRDLRLWEHAEGIVVQGRTPSGTGYETVLLTDDDLRDMLVEAYRRRGTASPSWLNSRG
jgi:hypothetical protein